MIRRFMGAVALAAAMLGSAQANVTSADYVYNYSGPTGYAKVTFNGASANLGVRYTIYGGLNLTGALLGTWASDGVTNPVIYLDEMGSNSADLADGEFSVLWHADDIGSVQTSSGTVQSQSDVYLRVYGPQNELGPYYSSTAVGQNCLANPSLSVCATALPPGPSGSDVPEPTSLALVGIAALAGIGASRRRAQAIER